MDSPDALPGGHFDRTIDGRLVPRGTVVHENGDIDSQACVGCRLQTLSIVELACDDVVYAVVFQCRACQAASGADPTLAWWRRKFEALRRRGVDRAAANRIIMQQQDAVAAQRRE